MLHLQFGQNSAVERWKNQYLWKQYKEIVVAFKTTIFRFVHIINEIVLYLRKVEKRFLTNKENKIFDSKSLSIYFQILFTKIASAKFFYFETFILR